MSVEPIQLDTFPRKKWRVLQVSTERTLDSVTSVMKGDVVLLATAIYKKDITKLAPTSGTTTDAIMQDPVWRKRLSASLEEFQSGAIAPIDWDDPETADES